MKKVITLFSLTLTAYCVSNAVFASSEKPQEYSKAISLFESYDKSDINDKYNLVDKFLTGDGVEKDYIAAYAIFREIISSEQFKKDDKFISTLEKFRKLAKTENGDAIYTLERLEEDLEYIEHKSEFENLESDELVEKKYNEIMKNRELRENISRKSIIEFAAKKGSKSALREATRPDGDDENTLKWLITSANQKIISPSAAYDCIRSLEKENIKIRIEDYIFIRNYLFEELNSLVFAKNNFGEILRITSAIRVALYQDEIKNKLYDIDFVIANAYEKGINTKQNLTKAVEYYRNAIKDYSKYVKDFTLSDDDHSNAYARLGYIYVNGWGVISNYDYAKEQYEKAIKMNEWNNEANAGLGLIYLNGYDVKKDYKKAKEYFDKANHYNDNPRTMYYLGYMYKNGLGVEKDQEVADNYFKKSREIYEEQKNIEPEGLLLLSYMYKDGNGIEKSPTKAAKFAQKLTDLNHPSGQIMLSYLYQEGIGVEKNAQFAVKLLEKAAAQGVRMAENDLGYAYEIGNGVNQDLAKAKEFYEKAANQGLPLAINNLAVLYQYGNGVPQDPDKALKLYQKAAEKDDPYALVNLGEMYAEYKNTPSNIEKNNHNNRKAKEYFQRAAKLNYENGLFQLAYYFEEVEKNEEEAIKLYQQAADLGDAPAQRYLGYIYDSKGDYDKARELYELAAKQNDAAAINNLGLLYLYGNGVKQDLSKALELYKKAAELGDIYALNNLGWNYNTGENLPSSESKNENKAIEYYQKSAELGSAKGQYYLAKIYDKYPDKKAQAMELFNKAAEQDYTNAQKDLAEKYKESGDYYLAAKWYQKAKDDQFRAFIDSVDTKANKNNDANAQYQLGLMYENGINIGNDKSESVYQRTKEQYSKAAHQNLPEAQIALANLYLSGKLDQKEQTIDQAILWLTKLADELQPQNEAHQKLQAEAQMKLGEIYYNRQGVPFDREKAKSYFKRACDNGKTQVCAIAEQL